MDHEDLDERVKKLEEGAKHWNFLLYLFYAIAFIWFLQDTWGWITKFFA
jgi:hypothetical protein